MGMGMGIIEPGIKTEGLPKVKECIPVAKNRDDALLLAFALNSPVAFPDTDGATFAEPTKPALDAVFEQLRREGYCCPSCGRDSLRQAAETVKRIARADKTDAKEKTCAEVIEGGETTRSLDYVIARLNEIVIDTLARKMPGQAEMWINPRWEFDGDFEAVFQGLNLTATLAYLRAYRALVRADKGREET